ncbi:hypothetical protein JHK85_017543 [Glycine max]|nr:hypothetical protein JHK85_017543 [Glycine max]KAG5047758.1 hypothetical protein JHK86_017164 [Glycine max]
MDLLEWLHDFLLVFLGSGLILGILICISLFYILSNSYFVIASQLFIYVGVINILIIFADVY